MATAQLNIRFNPNHTGDDLMARITELIGTDRATA